MSWVRMFDQLMEKEQQRELERLLDDSCFLNAIIDSGHSDIHYFGDKMPDRIVWEDMLDKLYEHDNPMQFMASEPNNLLPSPKEVHWQLSRIANEHVHCSTFMNRETALSAVHEVLTAGRCDVITWLNETSQYCNHTLVLRTNLDTILGTGITRNGNEHATTSCTVVLDRETAHVNGDIYPFRIRTCYPDITLESAVEGVWSTGRNYAGELQALISQTSTINQQRWALESYGELCSMRLNFQGVPTLYLSRVCNGASYYVRFNEMDTSPMLCTRFTSDEHGTNIDIPYNKGFLYGISADTQRAVGMDTLKLFKIFQSRTMSPEFFKGEHAGYLGQNEHHPSFSKEEI